MKNQTKNQTNQNGLLKPKNKNHLLYRFKLIVLFMMFFLGVNEGFGQSVYDITITTKTGDLVTCNGTGNNSNQNTNDDINEYATFNVSFKYQGFTSKNAKFYFQIQYSLSNYQNFTAVDDGTWNIDHTTDQDGNTSRNVRISTNGVYYIKVIVTKDGSSANDITSFTELLWVGPKSTGTSITAISPACPNSTINIAANGFHGNNPNISVPGWSGNNITDNKTLSTNTSLPNNLTGSNTSLTFTYTGADVYGCKNEASTTISILPAPNLILTQSLQNVCVQTARIPFKNSIQNNNSSIITANFNNNSTINWTNSANLSFTPVSNSSTQQVRNYNFNSFVANNSLHNISANGTLNACVDDPASKNIQLTAKQTPFADFTNLPIVTNVVQFNNLTTYTTGIPLLILTTTPTNYSWDFGEPSSGTNNTSNFVSPSHTYTITTFPSNFNVELCAASVDANCKTCETKTISVDAIPTSNFTTTANEYCQKSDGNGGTLTSIVFTNTTSSSVSSQAALNSFSYEWNFGDGTVLVTSNTNLNQSHSFTNAGIYTITLTVKNASQTSTSVFTKTITLNPHPVMNGTTDYIKTIGNCQNSNIEFKMGSFTSVSYSNLPMYWRMDIDGDNTNNSNGYDVKYTADNSTGFSPLQTSYSYLHTSAQTMTIKGQFEVQSTGCKTTYTEQFTIDPQPSASIVYTPNVTGMCKNEANPVAISSSNINTGNVYDWEYKVPSNTTYYATTSSFSPSGTMLEVGAANVKLKVKNSFGCWSNQATNTFNIWDIPKPNFTSDIVCAGSATAFTNTTANPQNTYLWEFNDNANSTSTAQNPTNVFDVANTYNVKLTVTENTHNCSDNITKSVTVKHTPSANFNIGAIKCANQTVDFTDVSTIGGSNTISNREWDWTNNGSFDLSSTNVAVQNTYIGAGTYTVKLKATGSNGCFAEKTNSLTILPQPAIPTITVPTNGNNNTQAICAGESYTLNASPSTGYSYSWFFNGNYMGNGFNTNSISDVGNLPLPDQRPYAVRITNAAGCYNTSVNTYISVNRLYSPISLIAGNNILCTNATATLSGSINVPTQNYQWKKDIFDVNTQSYLGSFTNVGSNNKTHVVDNANVGRYKFITSITLPNNNTCSQESPTIDITNAIPLALNYTGVVNINVNAPQVLTFINNTFPVYNTFAWYRNGILESTSGAIIVTKPGKYVLIALGSCGYEKSATVEFKYDCNAPGYYTAYTGTQTFNTPTTITGVPTIKIDGDWEITSGATLNLTNVNIVVTNCSKISVLNGTLNISGCMITGCDQWNGLVSKTTSSTININSSSISNAVVGASSELGGRINSTQSKFDNNNIHIAFAPHSLPNSSTIQTSEFGELNLSSPTCTTHPKYSTYAFVNKPMVYFESVNGINAIQNKFTCLNTSNANIIEGLQAKACTALTLSNNGDNGFLDKGINIRTGNNNTLLNNTFGFNVTSPSLAPFYSRSSWFKTGIALVDAPGSSIERNLITNATEGISFYQNTPVPVTVSNILKNRMENCTYGLVTATKENPALSQFPYQNSSSQTVYVQVNCNSFNSNSYGWIGTGSYQAQGSATLATGNTFNNNSNWNVCVADNPRVYYQRSGNEDIYITGGKPNFNMDGTIYTSSNYTTLCFQNPTGALNACNNKRSANNQSAASVDNLIPESIKTYVVYPNPVANNLQVSVEGLLSETNYKVLVYDMMGKVIYNQTTMLSIGDILTIDAQAWSSGMYALQIIDSEGQSVHAQKIVKN